MTYPNFETQSATMEALKEIASILKAPKDEPFVINKIPLKEFLRLYGRVDVIQNVQMEDNGNVLSIERTIFVSPAFLFRLGLDYKTAVEEVINVIHLVNEMGLSSYPVLSKTHSMSERLFRRGIE